MSRIIKGFFAITLLAAMCMLTACENTVSGFGKDMQSAGRNIEQSARE